MKTIIDSMGNATPILDDPAQNGGPTPRKTRRVVVTLSGIALGLAGLAAIYAMNRRSRTPAAWWRSAARSLTRSTKRLVRP